MARASEDVILKAATLVRAVREAMGYEFGAGLITPDYVTRFWYEKGVLAVQEYLAPSLKELDAALENMKVENETDMASSDTALD